MATSWAKCPDLFLYTKGKDVYLWRCNETTWMPMKTVDFDDLGKVMDHLDLVGGRRDAVFDWEESSYNDLVAYISSRRLLVNCRGLVIAELHEFDQDGKMEENGLTFYIRSLDVLSLKPFGLRDRTIPSRTVRYLETEGRAAPVDQDSTTTSSTESDEGKWRADMEKQVAELKAANKTLESDKEAAEKQVAELKEANETLKSDKEAAVVELKETNKTIKEAADKQVMELKGVLENMEYWMVRNVPSIPGSSNWVGIEGLNSYSGPFKVLYLTPNLSIKGEDFTCNIRSVNLHHLIMTVAWGRDSTCNIEKGFLKAIKISYSDLSNLKEKGRFDKNKWESVKYKGDTYAIKIAVESL